MKYYTRFEDWTTQKDIVVEAVSNEDAADMARYGIITYDTEEDALKFCTPRLVKVRIIE